MTIATTDLVTFSLRRQGTKPPYYTISGGPRFTNGNAVMLFAHMAENEVFPVESAADRLDTRTGRAICVAMRDSEALMIYQTRDGVWVGKYNGGMLTFDLIGGDNSTDINQPPTAITMQIRNFDLKNSNRLTATPTGIRRSSWQYNAGADGTIERCATSPARVVVQRPLAIAAPPHMAYKL